MTAVQPTAATDPDGPTGKLATWVADLMLDDVPQNVVERAKHLLLEVAGAAVPEHRMRPGEVPERRGVAAEPLAGHAAAAPCHSHRAGDAGL